MADEDERDAFNALTLLVAVCEHGLDTLARLDPEADGELIDAIGRARDLATAELRFGRFTAPDGRDA